jgi:protein kinase A
VVILGYLRITDLGIAKELREENSVDTSGTPGYMAPEVMCRQNHSFVVDYYAMGVITYELMMGKRPYAGRNRK